MENFDLYAFIGLITVVNAVIYYLSGVMQREAFNYRDEAEKARAEAAFYSDQLKDIFHENQDILERNRLVLHQIQTLREQQAQPNPSQPNLNTFLREQKNLFLRMSYDEFVDWLESGTIEDLIEARPYFESAGLNDHAEIMRVYLKDKGAL